MGVRLIPFAPYRGDGRSDVPGPEIPDDARDSDTLLRYADMAMYQAKRERSGIAMFRGDSERENRARLMLMAELRRAIADNQLRLWLVNAP